MTRIVPYRSDILTDAMQIGSLGTRELVTIQSANVAGPLSQSNAVANVYTPSFTVGNFVANLSDFTSVFDQYKIDCIEIILKPRANISAFGSPAAYSQMQGALYSVLDYDDATPLGSIGAALNYDNCIQTEVYQPNRRCFKPRNAMAVYAGTFTGFGNIPDTWIDAASTGVAHYGAKYICDAGTTAFLQTWDVQIRMKIRWRAVR